MKLFFGKTYEEKKPLAFPSPAQCAGYVIQLFNSWAKLKKNAYPNASTNITKAHLIAFGLFLILSNSDGSLKRLSVNFDNLLSKPLNHVRYKRIREQQKRNAINMKPKTVIIY